MEGKFFLDEKQISEKEAKKIFINFITTKIQADAWFCGIEIVTPKGKFKRIEN